MSTQYQQYPQYQQVTWAGAAGAMPGGPMVVRAGEAARRTGLGDGPEAMVALCSRRDLNVLVPAGASAATGYVDLRAFDGGPVEVDLELDLGEVLVTGTGVLA